MLDILIYNIIFWPVWIGISYIPQYIAQKFIDNYQTKC